jgi:hypothetical protein
MEISSTDIAKFTRFSIADLHCRQAFGKRTSPGKLRLYHKVTLPVDETPFALFFITTFY